MPPNPPSKAHGFAMRSMSLRDMQIPKSEKKNSWPPPLPNPGNAPDTDYKYQSEQTCLYKTTIIYNPGIMCCDIVSKKVLFVSTWGTLPVGVQVVSICAPTQSSVFTVIVEGVTHCFISMIVCAYIILTRVTRPGVI